MINKIDIYRIGTGDSVYEVYKSNKIGDGTHSVVYMGRCIGTKKINRDDKIVAIKKINLLKLTPSNMKMLNSEINIINELFECDHPNVIKYYDIIDDIDTIYIIMEYCENGDLSKQLVGKPLKYGYIKNYFRQIINAIQFIHNKNIIHRDIKPKNILIANNKKTIKICDFGFSKHYDKKKMNMTLCGSPLYMAPEIYKKNGYFESVDIWALGIIFYEMVYGYNPFFECNDISLLSEVIMTEPIVFLDERQDCINLLKQMLDTNDKTRISIEKLCQHDWMTNNDDNEDLSNDNLYRNKNISQKQYIYEEQNLFIMDE